MDVSRGCVLEKDSGISQGDNFTAEILWMDDVPLTVGKNFIVFLGTKKIPGILSKIEYGIDINTGQHIQTDTLNKNEIALCQLSVVEPIVIDTFNQHRTQGEFILIDRISNMTAACGVVRSIEAEDKDRNQRAAARMRSALNWQQAVTIAFQPEKDGISVEAISQAEQQLVRNGRHTYFYAPEIGEDYAQVVRHLNLAGVIVLLVLPAGAELSPEYKSWQDIAEADKKDANSIANAILRATMLDTVMGANDWSI